MYYFLNTYIIPFSSRIFFVEKLVWAPDPFQSCTGLGSKVTMTPYSSANLCSIYRATQRSSAAVTPIEGPTWNSHCEGITSALVPAMGTPAYRQHLQQFQNMYHSWAKQSALWVSTWPRKYNLLFSCRHYHGNTCLSISHWKECAKPQRQSHKQFSLFSLYLIKILCLFKNTFIKKGYFCIC